ncbi:MAG: hypothetical protein MUF68_08470 [Cyclobacteriaceae bacterium]|nr:hypothetical protein [Cyclobacteriaceae bacterium]
MKQVSVSRIKEWANRRFSYKILVNDKEMFELGYGEEKSILLEKPITIQAKLMWCGSRKIRLQSEFENIKQVRVKANRFFNVIYPVCILLFMSFVSVFNFLYPESEVKNFITGIMVGLIIHLVGMLTVWRNKVLEIELVRK